MRVEVVAAASQHVSVSTTTSGSLWLQAHFGLHWINKIIIKTLMLAYKATTGMTPPYLQSLIQPYNPSHSLRSANTGKLSEPSLKHPGQRSTRPRLFSLLAHKLWNQLHIAVTTADSLPIFGRDLKTHLFSKKRNFLQLPNLL